jgi:eukaryotic-like serine/threonine-protein kinase
MANITTAPSATGTTLIGEYRLMRELGGGSTGTVYLAEGPRSHRQLALKVLGRCERFLDEVRSMSRLEHEHIVPILDAGEEEGQCFLVMELLNGETLLARLKREHRLPVRDGARIGHEIAAGLAFAHAHGVIHRDVCPSNVWLEPTGRVRLLGFGSAPTSADDSLLERLGGPGTPGYLSPEQAAGEPVTPASDLFGLGCVLHQMMTGEQPFRGSDRQALVRAVVFDQPVSVREINPEIPETIADMISQLLSKLPTQRPGSAQEIDHRLREWLDPNAPKPAPLPSRLPEPVVYPASKRILDSLSAFRNAADPLPLPGWAQAIDARPANKKRGWTADIVAALLLLAGAAALYLWWKASK